MEGRRVVPGFITYRELFFGTWGLDGHECVFCGESIHLDDIIIHHLDHDRKNDDIRNLVPSHHGCHLRYHMNHRLSDPAERAKLREMWARQVKEREPGPGKGWAAGKERTPEEKEAIANGVRIHWLSRPRGISEEHKERIREAQHGQPKSAETRQKMSQAAKRRWARQRGESE